MPDGSKYGKTWNLFASIDPNYHLDHTPYKLELVVKKVVAENWDALEAVPGQFHVVLCTLSYFVMYHFHQWLHHVLCHVPCHVTSCHFASRHAYACHVMSCDVMRYVVMFHICLVPVAVQKRENIVTGKVESYPTSRPVKTNWTEVEKDAVKQEESEKPEGEAALQKLFQSIYAGADEVSQGMG